MAFRTRIGAIALLAAIAGGSACAMSPAPADAPACRVVDGAKLPAESGGADALCAAIRTALSSQPGASVEVRVLSPSMLAATVTTANGETLPEQKFASSDRALSKAAFERFARAIAVALAERDGR